MYKTHAGWLRLLLFIVAFFLLLARPAMASDLLLLDKLVKEKKFTAAYQQASQIQDDFTGQANFDFLFAIAAIESGHSNHAIFALERLIYQFPDNGRVKVELARAHFLSGNLKTSEDLFTEVLATSPPENVEIKIRAFLELIEQRRLQLENKLSGSIKFTAGWDSNYNSAPDLSVIQIGGISFSLNENSRQQDTGYTGLDASISYQQRINKKTQFTYGAYYQLRENISNELDTEALGIYFSPAFATDKSLFRTPIQYQQMNLDGVSYRQYGSLGVEWIPKGKPNSLWTHFLQYGMIRYPDYRARDMNLVIIGTSYQHVSDKGNLYQSAMHYNTESSDSGIARHLETDTLGFRGYGKWPLSLKNSLYSRITLQDIKYGENHPVFNTLRNDLTTSVSFGWELKLTPVTFLNLETEYLKNSSNIDVYDYDRTSAFISLRYDFL